MRLLIAPLKTFQFALFYFSQIFVLEKRTNKI